MTRSLAPRILFLIAFLALPAFADEPRLTASLFTEYLRLDPGATSAMTAIVFNATDETIPNPRMHVVLPPGVVVRSVSGTEGWAHEVRDGAILFSSLGIEPRTRGVFGIAFTVSDDPAGRRLTFTTVAGSPELAIQHQRTLDIAVYRHMSVTNALDAGPGSLRDRITEANEHCTGEFPCKVKVEIPTLLDDVAVIRPASPLPAITAADVIIGAAEYGPREQVTVELRGDDLASGNGLEIRSAFGEVTLRQLTIRNFPENGIAITDAGKPHAEWGRRVTLQSVNVASNGVRGIAIADRFVHAGVLDGEIAGNGRSGITAWAAASLVISYSFIGVTRAGVAIPNGASGVFLAPGVEAHISLSTIAHHPDFGIASSRGSDVSLAVVRMFANGAQDFDIGLDGPTPNDDESDGILNKPILTAATYNPSLDVTVILGRIETDAQLGWTFNVTLYLGQSVNRFGVATAEVIANRRATIHTTGTRAFVRDFTVELRGDHRGKFVSAQMDVQRFYDSPPYTSSELSTALEVR